MEHQKFMEAMVAAGLTGVVPGDVVAEDEDFNFDPVTDPGKYEPILTAIVEHMGAAEYSRDGHPGGANFFVYLTTEDDSPLYIIDFARGEVYWDDGCLY